MSARGLFPLFFSHNGTKDSATVTDWMLHMALVSLSEGVHVCVRVSFCGSGSFLLSFHSREKERQASKNKTAVCSVFFYCCAAPIFYKTIGVLFFYFTMTIADS